MEQLANDGSDRILHAALELFSERGFAAVSVQEIAQHAGLSKATVFHHFPNKEQLYLAVMRRACLDTSRFTDGVQAASASPLARLREFDSAHLAHLFGHPGISRLMLREAMEGEQQVTKAMAEEVMGEHFRRVVALIREGQTAGLLRADLAPETAAIAVAGLNVFLFQTWPVLRQLPGGHFADWQQCGHELFELLLGGIAAPGGKE